MNIETIFVTKEYFDLKQRELQAKETELAVMRAEKIASYQSDTNTWHDNFAYENAARAEALLRRETRELSEQLKSMTVCPNTRADVPTTAEIWTFIRVAETNLETSETVEKVIGIAPVGGEDFAKHIYNYRAPIVCALVGARVDETRIAEVPSGKIKYDVLEITRMI
jgi:transcription elongation GreA/GreB family factor